MTEVPDLKTLKISLLFAVGAMAVAAAAPGRGAAILASAALPGSGQLLLGERGRGEAMLWVDAGVWAFYGGSIWARSQRERDAFLYAGREAGAVTVVNKPAYLRALERYDNAEQFNEDVRRDARARYPNNPQAQHDYYLANGYFGNEAWDWSSDSARLRYYSIRKSARSAALQAQFATGALLLGRLVSVVDCAFFARVPAEARRVRLDAPDDAPGIGLAVGF